MNTLNLNDFLTWQQEAPDKRKVSIEIGNLSKYEEQIKIWVYDWELKTGQHVSTVDEIDLEAKRKEEDQKEYMRLKQICGGECIND